MPRGLVGKGPISVDTEEGAIHETRHGGRPFSRGESGAAGVSAALSLDVTSVRGRRVGSPTRRPEDERPMSDQTITCSDCGDAFVFTESEQHFYEEKGLGAPKRCKACRAARKAASGGPGRGSGGGSRGSWGDNSRARSSDGRPSSGSERQSRGGERQGGWGRFGGGAPAPRGDGARASQGGGDARPFAPRGEGRGRGAFAPRRDPSSAGPGQAPRPAWGRGDDGPGQRPRRTVHDAPPGTYRPKKSPHDAPSRAEPREDKGGDTPPPAKSKKKKADRPKFDVTCVTCGAAAQVPFEPIPGRDIFCQPCYRARRAAPSAEAGAPSPPEPTE
jgi:CxxC-x17-CxxC domain-containing protein